MPSAEADGSDGVPSGINLRRVLVAAAVALTCSAPFAAAQTPSLPPPSIAPSPSVIGRQVLDEREGPGRKAEIDVPASGGVQVPPDLARREVAFRNVTVEGATAFGPADFAPLFAPILNRRVAFSEVVAAVNRITQLYEKGGYVFYSVVLPKQDLDGDRLRVVVLEGSVSRIEIEDGISSPAVRERIEALLGRLKGRHPLKRADLERQLLLAADTPGVSLAAAARPDPSGDPAKVVLVVGGTFERFTPIATIDSFQTTPDTSVNFRVGGIGRSLLTGGDALELRYLSAVPWGRLHLFDVRYGLPVGLDGGRLSFLGQMVWQRPPATLNGQPVDFLGRSILGRVQYTHPIVRRLDWTVTGFGMVDVIDVDYTLAGIGVPGDSLRVLRSGSAAVFKDGLDGVWSATALASVGLDVASAVARNRAYAGPSFFKLNVDVQRIQPLGRHFALVLRAAGQMSGGTLPAAEVFSFGGRDFGRAFNVSESVADRGAAVSAELRYAVDWLGIDRKLADPQLYVFADHGWLSSADPLNAPVFAQASTAGGGVRVRAFQKYTGEIELAKALDASPIDTSVRPWRVSFRVGTNF
ncbi:MAG: ShlB/FhaC/HecB family hemolysin secretion/activation protein [Proteobacteria bacterium]|nr:ShlB/FhaC/HecB family hemolysin secretion/activation protein [Pseudomonadota bacterium]